MPDLLAALLAASLCAQASEPAGVARIRRDAEALGREVTTDLARKFLEAAASLPAIAPLTLFYDPATRAYLTEEGAGRLDSRDALRPLKVDESFYYNTRYGSPLAYARPLELLGKAGLADLAGLRVLDFGCGGVGPLRMMAARGADVVGVDVDPMLAALYSRPEDQGAVGGTGRVALVIGRYPADEAIGAKVGEGFDLILSKNTLKRGFVRPESGRAFVELGVDDSAFLKRLHAALKPGGRVMIYNLSPAQGRPYKPMADGRNPFPRAAWESAGFRVEAFDRDDTEKARAMGIALGWDKGPGAMDLANDLFASYTLATRAE